jgi:signal transduction histidine kinase
MEFHIAPRDILMQAFPGIEEKEAAEIVACGKVISVPPGTIICRENEYEQTFYIVLDGKTEVTKRVGIYDMRKLNDVDPGEFFGEMAILGDAPRAATVTAVQATQLLEIHKEAFTGVLQANNSVLLAIVRAVSQRLRSNDAMATEDLRIKAKELADAYQQLAEEDYARSQFLSTVAHELRTPLTAASGFVQVIRMGMLQGDALDSALETVSRNLQEITSLTNDILFMQEMDMIMPRFQPVNISSVVTQAVEGLHEMAEQNQVGIKLSIAAGQLLVDGHAKSLQRALRAILDNAIKFSPDGGDVEVSVAREDCYITIRVCDHGVGIPSEVMPRIFQRFFHVDQVGDHLFRGIGIGLSIARQVIKQHHGRIAVESEAGKGSTFTIYINAI